MFRWEFPPSLKELCRNTGFRTCSCVLDFLSHFQKQRFDSISKTCSLAIMVSISVAFQFISNGISHKTSPNVTKIHIHQLQMLQKLGVLARRRGFSNLSPNMLGAPRGSRISAAKEIGFGWSIRMTCASNWGRKKWVVAAPQCIFLIVSKDHPPNDSKWFLMSSAIVMVPWIYFETFEYLWRGKETHIQPKSLCGMTPNWRTA